MTEPAPTWLVLVRDVSHLTRPGPGERAVATMVLDGGTGLVRGISVGPGVRESAAGAMTAALTNPAGPLPPAVPAHVVCAAGLREDLLVELPGLLDGAATPEVVEGPPIDEAEDIFDSFVGHLAGRRQPEEFPTSEDWALMYGQAIRYWRRQPWREWSDVDILSLEFTLGRSTGRCTAVILGNAGIQCGLALYPGPGLPANLAGWEDGRPDGIPDGTVLFWLDPPGDTQPEFADKARRYGWPADADTLPTVLGGAPDGPADLDQRGVQDLAVAFAAILAHDQRHGGPAPGAEPTEGELTLADGRRAAYRIW